MLRIKTLFVSIFGMLFSALTFAQNQQFNTDIVFLGHTNEIGEWSTLPATTIGEGNESQGILSEIEGDTRTLTGSLTYGLAEYCINKDCSDLYKFTVSVINNDCKLTQNGGFLDVTLTTAHEEYTINCTVTSSLNSQTPIPGKLVKQAEVKTSGNRHWEYFAIGTSHYLAAANSTAMSARDFSNNGNSSNVFKFNNGNFEPFQFLASANCYNPNNGDPNYLLYHGVDWRHFQVGGVHWLGMANNYLYKTKSSSDKTCDLNAQSLTYSFLYYWENDKFEELNFRLMDTDSARQILSYTQAYRDYLAVVGDNKNGKGRVRIYYLPNYYETEDAVDLKEADAIKQPALNEIQQVASIESFTVSVQTYLILAQSGANQDTLVYRVADDGQLQLAQRLATGGYVEQALVFTDINNNTVLFFGYATPNVITPAVYLWRNNQFEVVQNLDTNIFNKARAWTHFTSNNKDYVLAALGTSGAIAYEWSNQQVQTRFPYVWENSAGDNIVSATAFTINEVTYIALAKYNDGNSQNTFSPILRWVPDGE